MFATPLFLYNEGHEIDIAKNAYLPPASRTKTRVDGFSESRAARTHPAVPMTNGSRGYAMG